MSKISILEPNLTKIEVRKTVVISQSLATSNSFVFDFQNHVRFPAKYMIIRQAIYCPAVLGNDIGIYLLCSSLTSSNIGCVYNGVQANSQFPETTIQLTQPIGAVQFQLTP